MLKQRLALGLVLVVALLAPGAPVALAQSTTPITAGVSTPATTSMLIVENAGQWPAAARFQVWNSPLGPGTTWLAEDAIWLMAGRQVDKDQVDKGETSRCGDALAYLSLRDGSQFTCLPAYSSHALKLTFPGSNPDVRIEPFERAATTISYFMGADPLQWRANVPVWRGVRYVDLYPGIDLMVGGGDGDWRLEAAPGASVEQIRLQLEGATMAGSEHATLRLEAEGRPLSVLLPSASFPYLAIVHSPDEGAQTITITPKPAPEQPRHPLDNPAAMLYGTYLGGALADWAEDLAVDAGGNAFVTGTTFSGDFPTTAGALDPELGGSHDLFVAKLSPAGDALVYATFLGGNDRETNGALTVDRTGNVYVTGDTSSSDFPTTSGAFDTSFNGDSDGFVAMLSPDGSTLVFSTFFGGLWGDSGSAIAVDDTGKAFVTGTTSSSNFPTTAGAFDESFNGWDDAFALVLNAGGDALAYATYLGGDFVDLGASVAVDANGLAYIAGHTLSSDFPTTPGAFDRDLSGWDVFVLSLDPTGSTLSYATLLGGSGHESSYCALTLDNSGHVYLTGLTTSLDFPVTLGSWNANHNGGEKDAFVAKLNPTGSELVFSTYLGGSGDDQGNAIAVDGGGHVYIAGSTRSGNFPTTTYAFDREFNGGDCNGMPCSDVFLVKLNSNGSALLAATYLGGSSGDASVGMAVDQASHALVAGATSSLDFPTTPDAFDPDYNGGNYIGGDAFVAKLNLHGPTAVDLAAITTTSPATAPQWIAWLAPAALLAIMAAILRHRQSRLS